MATEITPSMEYLQRFTSPLWNLLELNVCEPVKIIEGQRGKHPFVVIEIQHRQHGLFGDHNMSAVTTFFIVTHLKKLDKPCIASVPIGYESSVDRDYVYLAIPSMQVRPGDWEKNVTSLVHIAEGLTESEPNINGKQKKARRTYTPVGGGAFVHVILGLIFAIVTLLFLASALIELHRFLFTHLPAGESTPSGWAFLFGAMFTFWCTLQHIKKSKADCKSIWPCE